MSGGGTSMGPPPPTSFHQHCGDHITLKHQNTTAVRDPYDFDNAIVFSCSPLHDNIPFTIRVEGDTTSWTGSLEMGVVVTNDPSQLALPGSATELNCSIILCSNVMIIGGEMLNKDAYGVNLDNVVPGETIGVIRTDKGELKYVYNGEEKGIAFDNVSKPVYAVVNLYGCCQRVSVVPSLPDPEVDLEQTEDTSCVVSTAELLSSLSLHMSLDASTTKLPTPRSDRLRFHSRYGSLVKLSFNGRTAERLNPLDEFNNGVVITHRPLQPDELFEIRIDQLVVKWSGSIEVGVTSHDPAGLDFPATMTNIRSGTTIMSGCGILTNGKGTRREYGEFNLDELREGDRIGMVRKSSGHLHFFVNGLDQGIAVENVPEPVWGVVDLYGMTVKVTIVDRDTREEQNLITRRNTSLREGRPTPPILLGEPEDLVDIDRLTFHSMCGSHAAVINNGRTVHRPNAVDDFNNGVVLTSRPLKCNEIFEIRLDKLVRKWAGSIELGVTTHAPGSLILPTTMTNVRSGTWMMTGNGVMHNGSTVIDEYGHNLDKLEEGDRVGAVVKSDGSLHFFVNGLDQGVAAVNLPGRLYGVIDLYGQAAQATLVDHSDYSPDSENSYLSNITISSEIRFHHIHGRNARVTHNGLTASRPRTLAEFNHAVVITNRSLKTCEFFELQIDQMVDRWSGSIEVGITSIKAEEFVFPSTLTDMDKDTWMLSGSNLMLDGMTIRGYGCDLDSLTVGTRIGMMYHEDSTLHYYINGDDQGVAFEDIPLNVYVVIDLYGQCAQVSIVPSSNARSLPQSNLATSVLITEPVAPPPSTQISHRFSKCCSVSVTLDSNHMSATRNIGFSNGLVFSSLPLDNDQIFEIQLSETDAKWAGTLQIGVTALPISENLLPVHLPIDISHIIVDTWYIVGDQIRKNNQILSDNYCPTFDWLRSGQKIGIMRCYDGALKFFLDGVDLGVAAINLPKKVFAVVDLFGNSKKITVTSKKVMTYCQSLSASLRMADSLEIVGEGLSTPTLTRLDELPNTGDESAALLSPDDVSLSEFHGRNVQIGEGRSIARRVASYNQAVVVSHRPLLRRRPFQIRIERINSDWACGLSVGVTGLKPVSVQLAPHVLCLKKDTWLVSSDGIFRNGCHITSSYALNSNTINLGTTIGILIDKDDYLHIIVDNEDLGPACMVPTIPLYALVDVNGRVEEISVVGAVNHDKLMEKGDLEVQEKVPQRRGKIEQKLSNSESYNSGIQQISSHAATSSLQSDTDNFNTQIQQLTMDLQRSQNSLDSRVASPIPNQVVQTLSTSSSFTITQTASSMVQQSRKCATRSSQKCPYFSMCLDLRRQLNLPDCFFVQTEKGEGQCYCADCWPWVDEEDFIEPRENVKGDSTESKTEKICLVPKGWARFPIRRLPKTNMKYDSSWQPAFMGSSPGLIRHILDTDILVSCGSYLLCSTTSSKKENKVHHIFSPSIEYVASEPFSSSFRWKLNGNQNESLVTLALQILVQPDSYKEGPPGSGSQVPRRLPQRIPRDAIEWVPREEGAAVPNALLVRLLS